MVWFLLRFFGQGLMTHTSSAIMVLGTAAGPPVLGYLLDIRWSMDYIMSGAAILLLIIFIISVSFQQK